MRLFIIGLVVGIGGILLSESVLGQQESIRLTDGSLVATETQSYWPITNGPYMALVSPVLGIVATALDPDGHPKSLKVDAEGYVLARCVP